MCTRFALLFTVMLALLSSQVWAAQDKPWKDRGIEAEVQAVCDKATALPYPPQDKPDAAARSELKRCASDELYYGIKGAKDYAKARACAFVENETRNGAGSLILMMLYANGYGVEKNFDLAIKAACESGGAPAEIEGRVHHLTELKTKPAGQPLQDCVKYPGLDKEYCAGKVDLCDDVTSGFMQGVCAARQLALKEDSRRTRVKELTANWSAAHQAAFQKLNKAAKEYFEARANNEVDQSGTARAALASEEEGALIDHFMAIVTAYEAGTLPSASAEAFANADHDLNALYTTVMQRLERGTKNGTMTKEGVQHTQRMWLAYCDAWVSFAALHYPALSADAMKEALTRERIAKLKELPFVM